MMLQGKSLGILDLLLFGALVIAVFAYPTDSNNEDESR